MHANLYPFDYLQCKARPTPSMPQVQKRYILQLTQQICAPIIPPAGAAGQSRSAYSLTL